MFNLSAEEIRICSAEEVYVYFAYPTAGVCNPLCRQANFKHLETFAGQSEIVIHIVFTRKLASKQWLVTVFTHLNKVLFLETLFQRIMCAKFFGPLLERSAFPRLNRWVCHSKPRNFTLRTAFGNLSAGHKIPQIANS